MRNPNVLYGSNGLDCGSCGRLLQYCTDRRLLRQGKQLHAKIIHHAVTPDNYLASKLITFYSRSNHLRDAHHLFDEIPSRNVFSWNALLMGYTHQNRFSDALSLFSSFLSSDLRPDNFTLSCALKVLSALYSDSRSAEIIHGYVLRLGYDSDVFVMNGLITFYSRCDDVSLGRKLFDEMPRRDIVTWNSLMAGYSQAGFYEECKNFYRELVSLTGLNLTPNGATIASVLQACGQSKDLLFGMEVHRFIIDNQIEMDIVVCNALLGFYAKCGSLDYASELFADMDEKDEVSYGSLISGYMMNGFVSKAVEIFRAMEIPGLSTWNSILSGLAQNNHHEQVLDLFKEMLGSGTQPNTVTLSSILPSLSHLSNLKVGKELHGYAVRRSYDRNIYVSTAIIDTYAKSGLLVAARQVFDQSKERSLIIWTSIISAYSGHGDAITALDLFTKMVNERIKPDSVTFTALLAACAHAGMVDEAWKIFDSMLPDYSIEPSMEHYACMVGVLSRAKRVAEAAEFIRTMPVKPCAKVWGALLSGASVSGDVEIGELACDHLFEMEPESTGNYITMANLYSHAGRWKEADRIRERMKSVGLKKIAGSSWIETREGLRSFIATDSSIERGEEIYAVLEGLVGSLRVEGNGYQEELDEDSSAVMRS